MSSEPNVDMASGSNSVGRKRGRGHPKGSKKRASVYITMGVVILRKNVVLKTMGLCSKRCGYVRTSSRSKRCGC